MTDLQKGKDNTWITPTKALQHIHFNDLLYIWPFFLKMNHEFHSHCGAVCQKCSNWEGQTILFYEIKKVYNFRYCKEIQPFCSLRVYASVNGNSLKMGLLDGNLDTRNKQTDRQQHTSTIVTKPDITYWLTIHTQHGASVKKKAFGCLFHSR